MLPVDDIDVVRGDQLFQPAREPWIESFVLEIIPDTGQRGCVGVVLDNGYAVVVSGQLGAASAGDDLDDQDVMAALDEPARQLVGTPAAAAAVGRERVCWQKDLHRV